MLNEQSSPSNNPKPARRRWIQFSLRTMIVAMAIFCIVFAMWMVPGERQRQTAQILFTHEVDYAFERGDRRFLYQSPFYEDKNSGMVISGVPTFKPLADPHPWYEHYCKSIKEIHCYDLAPMDWSTLPHLKRLCFGHDEATTSDANLTEKLLTTLSKSNTELESLELYNWKLNQAGLNHLSSLTRLEELNLDFVDLDGLNLDALVSLKSLNVLSLYRTELSDVELKKLQKLPNLKVLGVTVDGPVHERFEILSDFKNLESVYIDRSPPHFLRFHVTGDQFRNIVRANRGRKEGTKMMSSLAKQAQGNQINAVRRAAATTAAAQQGNNPSPP